MRIYYFWFLRTLYIFVYLVGICKSKPFFHEQVGGYSLQLRDGQNFARNDLDQFWTLGPKKLSRNKRTPFFNLLKTFLFRGPSKPRRKKPSSSYNPPSAPYNPPSSPYNPPPSSYNPQSESYSTPSSNGLTSTYQEVSADEKPPRIVNRTFGYICRITLSNFYCQVGTECDKNGNKLLNQ